jgi:hypothetical protein
MAELKARQDAYRATVVFRLGSAAGAGVRWRRSTVPTLDSDGVIRAFAIRTGAQIEAWLVDDAGETELERCEGRWRPAVRVLAAPGGVGQVPTMEESLAAFVRHVMPMERARRTRQKYATHRLTVLTWAVWKGVLKDLLPMSTDALRAFIWDALAFESTISVLKHCVNAIKAWHRRLGLPAPADGPGDYRRLTNSLARFQGTPRRMIFPLHARAVRRLLLLPVPEHAACSGPRGGCRVCREFLHRWRDCLLGAVATLSCSRCAEAGALQSCDLWVDFDLEAGYQRWAGGAALNVKIRKNDQFRQGHQPRLGVPRDPRLHVVRQLLAFMRAVGNGPRPGCTKRAEPQCPCPVCPPLFPRSADRGRSFDLSRLPTAGEASAMVVRALGHVGYNTALFSGISARRGGLSTAIEAGVPEAILWMQSGHSQDVAARRYIQLRSPKLLYRTWEAFRL